MSPEDINKLKQEHGDPLLSITSPKGEELIFKKPQRAIWTDFVDTLTRDRSSKEAAFRRLATACAVHPTIFEVTRIFDEYPALPSTVANELSEMAGAGGAAGFDVKKL
jgi:hypothetical protein